MFLILTQLLPVFALIVLGIAAERLVLVPKGGAATLNQLVFNLSMPCLIFNSLAVSKPAELAQGGYAAGTVLGSLLCFVLGMGIISRGFRCCGREGAMIGLLGAFPNAAFLGLPILFSLFPDDHDAVIAGTITAVVGLPLLLLGLFLQEWYRNAGQMSRMRLLRKVAASMLRNPILLASLLGVLVCLARIPLPDGVLAVCRSLAATATPCALVALGMALSLQMTSQAQGKANPSWQIMAHVLKLLLMPLLTWALMMLWGVPGKWVAMGVVLSAMPTGTMAYVVSETYQVCCRDTSQVILVNTALSVFSIPLTVLLLRLSGTYAF